MIPAGWAELIEQLRGFSISAIGLEASGGYERGVMRALLAAGMPVRQINPFRLRQFANASGVLAKNDRLDARMIAAFVAIIPTRPAQRPAPVVERLAEVLRVRRQLSNEKVAAENAAGMLENAVLKRLSRRHIARLAADINMLDEHLVERSLPRSGARASIPAADLHAGRRTGAGLHADCALARARTHEPQTGRCDGRRCALCLRERQA